MTTVLLPRWRLDSGVSPWSPSRIGTDRSFCARRCPHLVEDVHELFDGTVGIRYREHVLVATPFRKDGAVRQQDVAENKYLATILERLRQNQIADDAQKLATGTKTRRAKRQLSASLEAHRAPAP